MDCRNPLGTQAKELRENAHELKEEALRKKAKRQERKQKRKEGAKLLKEGIFGNSKKDKKSKEDLAPELIINTGAGPYQLQTPKTKPSFFAQCFSCGCGGSEEEDLEEDRRHLLDV